VISTAGQYYAGFQIKNDDVRGECGTVGRRKDAYRVLVGKPKGKRPRKMPWPRWSDNIKMYLQEVAWGTWTGLIWLRIRINGGLF
jgi:hypothetical protein